MKLNLGCGDVNLPGFINIDNRIDTNYDVLDDVRYLREFEENSVSLIYASHILEHFSRHEYKDVLSRWYSLLSSNGILRVAVPDLESAAQYYIDTKDLRAITGLMYGGQDYSGNFHHWGWDYTQMENDLFETGFVSVYRYDWKKTEHSEFDDFSRSHLPHDPDAIKNVQFDNHILVSLNMEAIK